MEAAGSKAPVRDSSQTRVMAYQASHGEGVFRLSAQVFGPGSEAGLRQRWRWIDRAAGNGLSARRWVLVSRDAVVGFLAAMPLRYRVGRDVRVAYTPSEYMVHSRSRFHGIQLMRAFFDACDDCVTCDDVEATLRVTEWLGAQRVARVVRHAKVLDARVVRRRTEWAHAPLPGLGLATSALAATDHLRFLRHRRMRVTATKAFDARFDRLFDATDDGAGVSVVRDARFLNWRYGPDSPHADRQVRIVESGGEIAGYVVYHRSTREGRIGRILDLQVRHPEDRSTFETLLAHAVMGLRSLGAWSVRFHLLEEGAAPWVRDVLNDYGFGAREHHVLLVRMKDPAGDALARDPKRWRLAYGDTEASFAGR